MAGNSCLMVTYDFHRLTFLIKESCIYPIPRRREKQSFYGNLIRSFLFCQRKRHEPATKAIDYVSKIRSFLFCQRKRHEPATKAIGYVSKIGIALFFYKNLEMGEIL